MVGGVEEPIGEEKGGEGDREWETMSCEMVQTVDPAYAAVSRISDTMDFLVTKIREIHESQPTEAILSHHKTGPRKPCCAQAQADDKGTTTFTQ